MAPELPPLHEDDVSAFRFFRSALLLADVEAAFACIKSKCDGSDDGLPLFVRKHAKELWDLLDKRRKEGESMRAACQGKRVVIVGGIFSSFLHVKCSHLLCRRASGFDCGHRFLFTGS